MYLSHDAGDHPDRDDPEERDGGAVSVRPVRRRPWPTPRRYYEILPGRHQLGALGDGGDCHALCLTTGSTCGQNLRPGPPASVTDCRCWQCADGHPTATPDLTDAVLTAEFVAWTGRDPTAVELTALRAKHFTTVPAADTWIDAQYLAALTDALLTTEFRAWTGRDPTSAELIALRAQHFASKGAADTYIDATYAAALTDATLTAEFRAWTGRAPTGVELAALRAQHFATTAASEAYIDATYAKAGGSTNPGLPGPPSAGSPPPLMLCQPPASPVLDVTERWYLTDPVACLWEIIRDGMPLPTQYAAPSQLIYPQTAASAITGYLPLPTRGGSDTTGLTPSVIPITDGQLVSTFLTMTGRYPTTTELADIRAQSFVNVADLQAYVQTRFGGLMPATAPGLSGTLGEVVTWARAHWLWVAGGGLAVVLLTKKKR